MLPTGDKEKKILWIILLLLAVLISVYLLYYQVLPALIDILNYIIPIFTPFVIAFIFAELLDPLINWLSKTVKINRTLSILIVLFTVFGLISLLVVLLVSRLVIELIRFSNSVPKYSAAIVDYVIGTARSIENLFVAIDLPDQVMKSLEESVDQGLSFIKTLSGQAIEMLLNFLGVLPSGFLLILFALIAIFFFSRDKHLLQNTMKKILPHKIVAKIELIFQELEIALIGFIRAQLILMMLTTALTFIGLIILGVDYAVIIAILVGIVDALPIFGPGAVFVPWILWAVIIKREFAFALALLVLYTIVSITRQVMQPKVLGDNVGMHPLEALIVIYAGIKLFGVAGVITGPIIWVLAKAVWKARI